MTIEERDEKDFIENGTVMAKTTRNMFDYDSSLVRIIDQVNGHQELNVDDSFLLYNFLQDLQMYRKFFGPETEVFKKNFEKEKE